MSATDTTALLDGAKRTKRAPRRIRSPHPGVKIKRRHWDETGRTIYYARWRDPDSRRLNDTNLTSLGRTTIETRRDWAIEKSRSLAARRAALASGAPRKTETSLADAIASYLKESKNRLRPATVSAYKDTSVPFLAWAKRLNVQLVEELDRGLLMGYRDVVAAKRRSVPVPDAERFARRDSLVRRSPATVNRELRHIKALLNHFRAQGKTPQLDKDAITDCLKSVPGFRAQPTPLNGPTCEKILEAALRYDLDTFQVTREEHASDWTALEFNQTLRHAEPIAPFVMFVLLTGCRFGEAIPLRWSDVDLDAPDDYGNAGGEVRLTPTATKTRIGRRIDLSVSPALRSLLKAMKLRAGGEPYVFGGRRPLHRWRFDAVRRRLSEGKTKRAGPDKHYYGSPPFSWQQLRQTCASFLTNAPGIFRAASIYRSAEQLGHSPAVAMRFYLGVIKGIPPDARSLEEAMRITGIVGKIVRRARGEEVEVPAFVAAS